MLRTLALILLASASAFAQTPDQIRAILAERIDTHKKVVGIAVGVLDDSGARVIGHGRVAKDRAEVPDGDTIFEIGSITKVFTSVLLADMIERGEVKPDDPVEKYLPDTVKVPSRNGKKITLLDISMQHSGLPRMPENFKPKEPSNPYADYSSEKLYEFLNGYTLPRDPGEKYEYSNVAVGLLGHALARRAGMSYEALLRQRIFGPLKMSSSTITFSAEHRKHLATGHNAALQPVSNWDLDAIAGAGAIRSTVNDMLKFLAAASGRTPSPLAPAFTRMLSVRKSAGGPLVEIAMGWHIFHQFAAEIVWHNGGTAGFRTFAGYTPANKKAVVVLTNTSFDSDDIGRHILEPKWPLTKIEPPKEHKEIAVTPGVLDAYPGTYELAPQQVITVTRDGPHLFAEMTGQSKIQLFAEAPDQFFLKVVDATINFEKDANGKVTRLVLNQAGQKIPARRVP
jgi:CubicO group peptidase (beta-lactamase class C family)